MHLENVKTNICLTLLLHGDHRLNADVQIKDD